MMLVDLRNLYKSQLIKHGVAESKAEQASENLSIQQLQIVMQIWKDFNLAVNQSQQVTSLQQVDRDY
ncbi:hypothetical protein [Crocosphaera sp. Alani8]|uniref:hypothetical protein n=1 Tax=Crocosphaera sp. Alani8 TaxID=3038952 RepID=UPI00313D5F66